MKRPIVFGRKVVTEPLNRDATRAIAGFINAHTDELRVLLEPYGVDPTDILEPAYERCISEDEAPIFARMAREDYRRPRR
ncbi:hypothetical protein [Microbacterium terrisoli]|jgi:hypothetical protein|uniref:hypothetical protein n=1 Tax=Microbacterium terrisoli TaxID=3242192 RepID=UPI002805AEEF|nr:hypothetical protein [Microbacterium protaetiae]